MYLSRLRRWVGAALLLCTGLWAGAAEAGAQDAPYSIQGTVVDAGTQRPLAGARVAIQGTQLATVTDASGRYELAARLSPGEYTLNVTLLGHEATTRRIQLGTARTVTVPAVTLAPSALELGELIVTGTAAPTSRRAIGNTVATVSADQIEESPATTIDQALQGRVPGALITSNTGTPGGGVSIRLRGTSSIVGGAEPLIIVDGVIIDNNADQQINLGYRSNASNRLADLDPNDVDRIEILKGAAATALYGSRANNGVVQIFTKRGRAGETQFSVSTHAVRSDLPRRIDFALTPVDLQGKPVTRFDHQDLLFRDTWGSDTHLSVSGGADNTRYFLSAGYVDQEGIMIGSGHEKLNTRLNLDQDFGRFLSLSAGANYIRSHTDLVINGEQGAGGLLTAIVFTPTTVDLAARNPETGEFMNRAFVFPNPLEVVEAWDIPQDLSRFVGSLQARSNPLTDLTLEYRFGYDRYEMETRLTVPRGTPSAMLGTASSVNRTSTLLNNDVVANYTFQLGDPLRMTSSLGANHTYQRVNNLNAGARDLVPLTRLVRGAVVSASEGQVEAVTIGFFGQQQASWRERLFLTGALRWDASSTFGADERWQLYPKVSGSYVLSEEDFFRNSPVASWVGELRFRGAYGFAGNQPPLDQAYSRISRYGTAVNIDRLGLIPLSRAGNPELKPERQREIEAGFDVSALNDRIGLSFTWYDQETRDLLLDRVFAPSSGVDVILDNIGQLSNSGIELQLNTVNLNRGSFRWSSNLIYSRNRNVVDKLEGDPFFLGYGNRVEEGQPLGVLYLPAFKRDARGNIVTDSIGPVAAGQREIVGNPWPDYTASLANEFRLGNWTATVLLDGQFGHDLWNQTRRIMDIFAAGPLYDQLLRGEITPAERTRIQSIWEAYVEDASFVKLRDVSLRYGIPERMARRLGASSVQLELLGRNLYTWTDYTGYDPEINMFGLNTVERGVDFAVYPNARTVSLGIRVNY